MKYRGRKISTLIALGLTSAGLTIAALKKPIPNPFGTHEVVSEDNTYVPEEVIKEITEELKNKEIVLDGKYSKYIKGITIDYDHISIDLVNDEKIEGTIIVPEAGLTINTDTLEEKYENSQSITIEDLDLDILTVMDTKLEEEVKDLDCDITELFLKTIQIMHNYPELSIKRTTVKDEFKFEKVRTKESSEYEKWIDAIDLSHCQNV